MRDSPTSVAYHPLSEHSGLGPSAFYIALLITMAGFLSATIVNVAVTILYDRKGMHPMEPGMLEYVHRSAGAYRLEAGPES